MAGEPPLRVWREHRGLSAAALAATVGITPAHVSKLETGRGEPSISLLKRLSKALDADVDLLLGPK
jgi:transcriptional regulator with XRE-family HTH domain